MRQADIDVALAKISPFAEAKNFAEADEAYDTGRVRTRHKLNKARIRLVNAALELSKKIREAAGAAAAAGRRR